MPLTEEELAKVKESLDRAETSIRDLEDILSDMRTAGLEATVEETRLEGLRATQRRLRMFFDLQQARRAPSG